MAKEKEHHPRLDEFLVDSYRNILIWGQGGREQSLWMGDRLQASWDSQRMANNHINTDINWIGKVMDSEIDKAFSAASVKVKA